MTYAPATIRELAAYWSAQGGVNLGIVGDASHQAKGVSYHLGKDQLQPDAYSARRPRDKAGLTDAASAIDLGRLDGSYAQLRAFSDWLARKCLKEPDALTRDVVEVIYSPDGKRVLGYKDGIDFLIPDYGDLSHLTHTHISYFRDSELRDKTELFGQYFTEEPMGVALSMISPYDGTATVVGSGHSYIRVHDGLVYPVAAGFQKKVYARARLAEAFTLKSGGVIAKDTPVVIIGDTQAVLLEAEVTLVAAPAADTKHPVEVSVDGRIVYSAEV